MEPGGGQDPRYIAVLAAAASLVLLVGWLLRPREIPSSPPPVPSDADLAQVARRAQRRTLEDTTRYFAELADELGASVAFLGTAGTGTAWDDGRLIAGPLRSGSVAGAVDVQIAGQRTEAVPQLFGPFLPLSLWQISSDSAPRVAPRAAAQPAPGAWVLALWHTGQARAFAAGTFLQSAPVTCDLAAVREVVSNVSLAPAMIGGGLFDLDGELLAVILPCGERIAAIDHGSVATLVDHSSSLSQRLLGRYGVLFDALSASERTLFGDVDGLLVRELWIDSLAAAGGLRAGDVLTALGGNPVAKIGDLAPLLARSQSSFEMILQRGPSVVTVSLPNRASTAVAEPQEDGEAGILLQETTAAWPIAAVLPGSRAARAGVQPGDRLVRVDGSLPLTREQAVQSIAGGERPTWLEIERGARRIAILMP